MPLVLNKALRNRWFIIGLHAGLWLLLCLTLAHLGGSTTEYRELDAVGNPPQSPAPVAGLERLFLPGIWPKSLTATNQLNPFYTDVFIPPAPPPPTTRTIQATYHGYHQLVGGAINVMFELDHQILSAPIGARITNDTFIANAARGTLTLTNAAGQTNIIGLNTNKDLTIPLK